jgi:hyperosmotically inducible periplasmic protein
MIRIKKQAGRLVAVLFIATTVAAIVPVASAQQSNDITTINQVRKQLVTLPFYGVFDNLGYAVEGDTVTLYGQVVRPITRKDAERRVARVEGVEHVINRIEVLPLSRFDDSIRIRTLRAISRTGGLFRYFQGVNSSIHIIVRNGHVTLEGMVSNRGDSQLAYIAANQVINVFSVTNNLRVEHQR